jgi:hypothetical protein
VFRHRSFNFNGATHRVDDAVELDQQAIAHCSHDAALYSAICGSERTRLTDLRAANALPSACILKVSSSRISRQEISRGCSLNCEQEVDRRSVTNLKR